MSKLRSVNTKFWDDPFVVELNPTEKLLFLYLITNSLTTILGIYEISIRKISFDTGISQEMVRKGLERFGTSRKAFFEGNYIILPNWPKNQNLNTNMKKAVENEFDTLPIWLKEKILGNHSKGLGNGYLTIRNGLQTLRGIEVKAELEGEEKNNNEEIDFEKFWDLYDKKVGDKQKIKNKWKKLSVTVQKEIMEYIPRYRAAQPDKKYRKNPETFFNQKGWTHELIYSNGFSPSDTRTQSDKTDFNGNF